MAAGSPLRAREDATPTLPPLSGEAVRQLQLSAVSYKVRAGQEIITVGRRCQAVFLIIEGMAVRYRMLRDGQRQILDILLPGDFAGTVSCHFDKALYSIRTLTPTVVGPIPIQQFMDLFSSHPQLAARLFWRFSADSAKLSERLITVGRRPARARVAHFLLELLVRLQALGLADDCSYRLQLTQEMIGDALGLSVPYLNRVLHELRNDGLVQIRDERVEITDFEEMAALAEFEHAYLRPASIAASGRKPAGQGRA
jgi:CRP-like cAMP-binding protein